MSKLNIQYDGMTEYAFVEIDGLQIPMTLEVMNKVNPSDINDEFFSSESNFQWEINQEAALISTQPDSDLNKFRAERIEVLTKAIEISKSFKI